MQWTKEKAQRIRSILETAMAQSGLSDEEASRWTALFPAWETLLQKKTVFGTAEVEQRFRLRYNGALYVVTQPHAMQADWTPDTAASLYERVLYRRGIRVIPETITAAHPFSAGEKGIDEGGTVWISRVPDNVYTPAQYPDSWEVIRA